VSPTRHKCYCHAGYVLQPDKFSCKSRDRTHPRIIFSNRQELRTIDLRRGTARPLVSSLKNTIALDFFYGPKVTQCRDNDYYKEFSNTVFLPVLTCMGSVTWYRYALRDFPACTESVGAGKFETVLRIRTVFDRIHIRFFKSSGSCPFKSFVQNVSSKNFQHKNWPSHLNYK
jgi:hypothetical protein